MTDTPRQGRSLEALARAQRAIDLANSGAIHGAEGYAARVLLVQLALDVRALSEQVAAMWPVVAAAEHYLREHANSHSEPALIAALRAVDAYRAQEATDGH